MKDEGFIYQISGSWIIIAGDGMCILIERATVCSSNSTINLINLTWKKKLEWIFQIIFLQQNMWIILWIISPRSRRWLVARNKNRPQRTNRNSVDLWNMIRVWSGLDRFIIYKMSLTSETLWNSSVMNLNTEKSPVINLKDRCRWGSRESWEMMNKAETLKKRYLLPNRFWKCNLN